MSSKTKKARRAVLRQFLLAIPETLDRAAASLGWLVVVAGLALGALVLHMLFAPHGPPPAPPSGGAPDNPQGALYVRDLGRLPDGRHTFDLVYALVLRSEAHRPATPAFTIERLSVGDPPPAGDAVDLGPAPGASGPATGAWHEVSSFRRTMPGQPATDFVPGDWRALRVHYRLNARPDQFADVALGYGLNNPPRGWFDTHWRETDLIAHDEEVQLGAVLRAHCPLGVKVQNGEMRSLCGL